MNHIFRTEGPIYALGQWIGRLFLLTVLWVAASLPCLTIGAASAASLYICRKWLAGDTVSLVQDFWASFLDNLRHGIAVTLVWAALFIVLWINFQTWHFLGSLGLVVYYLQWGVFLVVVVAGIYAVAILAGYRQSVFTTIFAAFLLVIRHLGTSLLLLVGGVGYLSALYYFPILMFFGAGLMGLWITYWTGPILASHASPSSDGI